MLHKKFDKILRNHLTCVTRCGIMGAAQAELVCKLKNIMCLLLWRTGTLTRTARKRSCVYYLGAAAQKKNLNANENHSHLQGKKKPNENESHLAGFLKISKPDEHFEHIF
jgi:hypothetical protein